MKKSTLIILGFFGLLFQTVGQEATEGTKKLNWNHSILINVNGNAEGFGTYLRGLSLRYAGDYEVKESLRIGGGTGVSMLDAGNPVYFFPVFVRAECHAGKKNILPGIATEIGYGFALYEKNFRAGADTRGGLYLHPSVGMGWRLHPELELWTKIGYLFQRTSRDYDYDWTRGTRVINYQRLTLNFGFRF